LGYLSQQLRRGLFTFMKRFPDEQACRDFLVKTRWPNGFACPACGSRRYWFIHTRELFECKDCRRQTSLTAGTVMDKTRAPLRAWFGMIYLMARAKSGVSIRGAAEDVEISYKTAWLMAHKIRYAMAEEDEDRLLNGIIELDESYFGGKSKPGKRGRGAAGKAPVLVGVTICGKGPGEASMRVLPSVSVINIKRACEKMIRPGATVVTDGFPSYEKALIDYTHEARVLHSSKAAGKKLPWVHLIIHNAKTDILGSQHGVSPKHLQRYLSEFCWRFSRRHREGDLFDMLVGTCVKGSPLTWSALARGPGP
jgi:transposase-like protein